MKNYFKKFSIMFVMALMFIGIGMIQNGSAVNAATVGQQLTSPDTGWKRIDAKKDGIISFNGTWFEGQNDSDWNGTVMESNTGNSSVKFNFYGTKIRFVTVKNIDGANNARITIDGNKVYSINLKDSLSFQILVSEVNNLSLGVHTVVVDFPNAVSTGYIYFDAIDIDENGKILPYGEAISLNQSIMDLRVGDSQQLTTTTTPAGAQVTWSSDNTRVATVNPTTGEVTGVSEGTCTITATTVNGLAATCTVTVTKKDDPQPTNPTGDANLFIELVDGQIKQYTVSQDEINKFTSWFENRDKDHSFTATYKFTKGTYKDYVVHDQIDWFEVR
ncbi:uncharacterized protein YjdB [Clostridium saccharoperbutylacetonicum]|uniref:Bacterial surface protein containing Ig-like domain n=1 Tax=Clostridium saccharoperbutylacetonicum N1-4(HMT) TaxID=931276 RepID=M1MZX8_9CLOT|nr:Ig-like domain-containing protein [Clostridium saccharoperbutylacetonicum]AGF56907.1 bacterial surface protein containing Ig-like domain [Clostridium saccharoperbutylacetonicum N1-4(HMT)]NRT62334.1 uncharacterized protein YjdB [Clostridium saccharoperbutylacetonicum]NSB25671.1 uncharacterized protein YjdB [Clostridium saccharoperbutylacetonicum]NSB45037.1 uncharacterized protein YjdB [Clostridium saccharoperbutylacetonicum]